jgi:crotonobetainyl-CoA:carnitine CoA-transferase CaiB-like acyl-CoA transferase
VRQARAEPPLVIDLSSLWAGPLCTHLLELAGARVVKLESTRRPDGARSGPPDSFALLNSGKASVALDFGEGDGLRKLHRILEPADIVVESARPRALAQLGVDAQSWVESVPGRTWVSLTGYGRREPGARWIAFGDDAGVAAGLAAATGGDPPLFCGDAIADPLTGLHAALAALACWRAGGGYLLDLALSDVAAHVLAFGPAPAAAEVHTAGDGWEVVVGQQRVPVSTPRARPIRSAARPLGADTDRVLEELGISC